MDPGVAIPILPSRDLDETRAFYERLGFQAPGWWPSEFGGYAILVRGDLTMHFFAFKDISPYQNYAQCYWRVMDSRRAIRRVSSRRSAEIRDAALGTR